MIWAAWQATDLAIDGSHASGQGHRRSRLAGWSDYAEILARPACPEDDHELAELEEVPQDRGTGISQPD